MSKIKKILRKSIIIFTVVTFVLPSLTWSFNPKAYLPAIKPITWKNQEISIPPQRAKIKHAFKGNKKLVVHMQDLHCNYEVQQNIAEVIKYFAANHTLKLVGIEGTDLALNTTYLSTIPDQKIKQEIGQYLMQEGKLSGAEYYAATTDYPVLLDGVEAGDLYRKSHEYIKIFLNNESQGYIHDLKALLSNLKNIIYNEMLLAIDEKKQTLVKGDLPLMKYCVYLYKYATSFSFDLRPYTTLNNYISKRKNILPQALNPEELYQEIESLEQAIRDRLYTTDDQILLDAYINNLEILEKILNISVTPEELKYYRENNQDFYVQNFIEFIKTYTPEITLDPQLYQLDKYLKLASNFYQLADKRSEIFVEKILTRMQLYNTDIAILITGGYHTPEVLQTLQNQGVSYVSLKPQLTKKDIVNPYFSLLKNSKLPLEKLLAKNQDILSLEPSGPKVSADLRDSILNTKRRTQLLSAEIEFINMTKVLYAGIKLRNLVEKGIDDVKLLLKKYSLSIQKYKYKDLITGAELSAQKYINKYVFTLKKMGLAILIHQELDSKHNPLILASLPGKNQVVNYFNQQIWLANKSKILKSGKINWIYKVKNNWKNTIKPTLITGLNSFWQGLKQVFSLKNSYSSSHILHQRGNTSGEMLSIILAVVIGLSLVFLHNIIVELGIGLFKGFAGVAVGLITIRVLKLYRLIFLAGIALIGLGGIILIGTGTIAIYPILIIFIGISLAFFNKDIGQGVQYLFKRINPDDLARPLNYMFEFIINSLYVPAVSKKAEVEQPVKAAEQPVKEAEQPVKEAEQPVKAAEQPVKAAEQPVKAAEQPVKPVEQPIKPVEQPVKPAEQPVEPSDHMFRLAEVAYQILLENSSITPKKLAGELSVAPELAKQVLEFIIQQKEKYSEVGKFKISDQMVYYLQIKSGQNKSTQTKIDKSNLILDKSLFLKVPSVKKTILWTILAMTFLFWLSMNLLDMVPTNMQVYVKILSGSLMLGVIGFMLRQVYITKQVDRVIQMLWEAKGSQKKYEMSFAKFRSNTARYKKFILALTNEELNAARDTIIGGGHVIPLRKFMFTTSAAIAKKKLQQDLSITRMLLRDKRTPDPKQVATKSQVPQKKYVPPKKSYVQVVNIVHKRKKTKNKAPTLPDTGVGKVLYKYKYPVVVVLSLVGISLGIMAMLLGSAVRPFWQPLLFIIFVSVILRIISIHLEKERKSGMYNLLIEYWQKQAKQVAQGEYQGSEPEFIKNLHKKVKDFSDLEKNLILYKKWFEQIPANIKRDIFAYKKYDIETTLENLQEQANLIFLYEYYWENYTKDEDFANFDKFSRNKKRFNFWKSELPIEIKKIFEVISKINFPDQTTSKQKLDALYKAYWEQIVMPTLNNPSTYEALKKNSEKYTAWLGFLPQNHKDILDIFSQRNLEKITPDVDIPIRELTWRDIKPYSFKLLWLFLIGITVAFTGFDIITFIDSDFIYKSVNLPWLDSGFKIFDLQLWLAKEVDPLLLFIYTLASVMGIGVSFLAIKWYNKLAKNYKPQQKKVKKNSGLVVVGIAALVMLALFGIYKSTTAGGLPKDFKVSDSTMIAYTSTQYTGVVVLSDNQKIKTQVVFMPKGGSLDKLGKIFQYQGKRVPTQLLKELNPMSFLKAGNSKNKSYKRIYPGTPIRIPITDTLASMRQGKIDILSHPVKKGDTLWDLSKKYGWGDKNRILEFNIHLIPKYITWSGRLRTTGFNINIPAHMDTGNIDLIEKSNLLYTQTVDTSNQTYTASAIQSGLANITSNQALQTKRTDRNIVIKYLYDLVDRLGLSKFKKYSDYILGFIVLLVGYLGFFKVRKWLISRKTNKLNLKNILNTALDQDKSDMKKIIKNPLTKILLVLVILLSSGIYKNITAGGLPEDFKVSDSTMTAYTSTQYTGLDIAANPQAIKTQVVFMPKGGSLDKLGKIFQYQGKRVPTQLLKELNPMSFLKAGNSKNKSYRKIYPGTPIKLPITDTLARFYAGELEIFSYTVKKGDTLWALSKKYGWGDKNRILEFNIHLIPHHISWSGKLRTTGFNINIPVYKTPESVLLLEQDDLRYTQVVDSSDQTYTVVNTESKTKDITTAQNFTLQSSGYEEIEPIATISIGSNSSKFFDYAIGLITLILVIFGGGKIVFWLFGNKPKKNIRKKMDDVFKKDQQGITIVEMMLLYINLGVVAMGWLTSTWWLVILPTGLLIGYFVYQSISRSNKVTQPFSKVSDPVAAKGDLSQTFQTPQVYLPDQYQPNQSVYIKFTLARKIWLYLMNSCLFSGDKHTGNFTQQVPLNKISVIITHGLLLFKIAITYLLGGSKFSTNKQEAYNQNRNLNNLKDQLFKHITQHQKYKYAMSNITFHDINQRGNIFRRYTKNQVFGASHLLADQTGRHQLKIFLPAKLMQKLSQPEPQAKNNLINYFKYLDYQMHKAYFILLVKYLGHKALEHDLRWDTFSDLWQNHDIDVNLLPESQLKQQMLNPNNELGALYMLNLSQPNNSLKPIMLKHMLDSLNQQFKQIKAAKQTDTKSISASVLTFNEIIKAWHLQASNKPIAIYTIPNTQVKINLWQPKLNSQGLLGRYYTVLYSLPDAIIRENKIRLKLNKKLRKGISVAA